MASNAVREGSAIPSEKTWYTAVGGAVVTLGAWGLDEFAHVEIPVAVTGAAVVVVSFIIATLVPAKWGKYVDVDAVLGLYPSPGEEDVEAYGIEDDGAHLMGDDSESGSEHTPEHLREDDE